jgi:hypothetical protein
VLGGAAYTQVLEHADLAKALQYAEYLAALGQIGGPRHDPQMHGERRQRRRSSDRHGRYVCCGVVCSRRLDA